jgi:hypothetical protein
VIFSKDGRENLLSPEDLLGMERKPVGDLSLIPLASFFPGNASGDLVIRAADGFEKRVPAHGVSTAFLDPESLRAVMVREPGAKIFTIRDVTQITLEDRTEPDGLVVVAGEQRHAFSVPRLQEMAEGGILPFKRLLKAKGTEFPEGGKVRLTARDGYTRDVGMENFKKGSLHMEGMRCEFPGLPSRDQVSDLKRIEIR